MIKITLLIVMVSPLHCSQQSNNKNSSNNSKEKSWWQKTKEKANQIKKDLEKKLKNNKVNFL